MIELRALAKKQLLSLKSLENKKLISKDNL